METGKLPFAKVPLDFKLSIIEVYHAMNIAEQIIEKAGGVAKVATICGRTHSWVYKWTYPKDRGGRGGIVPFADALSLIEAGARGEIPALTPADFFPTGGDAPTADP